MRVVTATGFAHPLLRRPQSFDLVLANILPRPLIALAPAMRRALRPGGVAVLSGLLESSGGRGAAPTAPPASVCSPPAATPAGPC